MHKLASRRLILVIASMFILGAFNTPTLAEPTAPADADKTTQDAWNVEYVGQIGGITRTVALQGSYAYLGVGPRLIVLDISDPAMPVEIGKTEPFPSSIGGIVVAGSYAYLANYTGGQS